MSALYLWPYRHFASICSYLSAILLLYVILIECTKLWIFDYCVAYTTESIPFFASSLIYTLTKMKMEYAVLYVVFCMWKKNSENLRLYFKMQWDCFIRHVSALMLYGYLDGYTVYTSLYVFRVTFVFHFQRIKHVRTWSRSNMPKGRVSEKSELMEWQKKTRSFAY